MSVSLQKKKTKKGTRDLATWSVAHLIEVNNICKLYCLMTQKLLFTCEIKRSYVIWNDFNFVSARWHFHGRSDEISNDFEKNLRFCEWFSIFDQFSKVIFFIILIANPYKLSKIQRIFLIFLIWRFVFMIFTHGQHGKLEITISKVMRILHWSSLELKVKIDVTRAFKLENWKKMRLQETSFSLSK